MTGNSQLKRAEKLMKIHLKAHSRTKEELIGAMSKMQDILAGPESHEKCCDLCWDIIKKTLG